MKTRLSISILTITFIMGISFVWAMWPEESYTVHIQVVDEEGTPIEGVKVNAGFTSVVLDNVKTQSIEGLTDKKGMTTLKGSSFLDVNFRASKKGWYDSTMELGRSALQSGETQVIHLRKIVNPIPMYAKRIELLTPKNKKAIGFDFEAGDWIAPYGNGKRNDMIVESRLDQREMLDYDHELIITFPNRFDGVQDIYYDTSQSSFRSDYQAPEEGYKSTWKYIRTRRPGEGEKGNVDKNRSYLLRVRTEADKNGNIVKANYVKIYGDFSQFTYYFNPTPNDRNLEFDPEKNLFKNLDSKITAP
ncbi:MAG: hypothetical protein AAGA64_07370 [Bacteroidota bacterium]